MNWSFGIYNEFFVGLFDWINNCTDFELPFQLETKSFIEVFGINDLVIVDVHNLPAKFKTRFHCWPIRCDLVDFDSIVFFQCLNLHTEIRFSDIVCLLNLLFDIFDDLYNMVETIVLWEWELDRQQQSINSSLFVQQGSPSQRTVVDGDGGHQELVIATVICFVFEVKVDFIDHAFAKYIEVEVALADQIDLVTNLWVFINFHFFTILQLLIGLVDLAHT